MNFKEYCNKVGLKVHQMFTPLKSATYGATRVFTGSRNKVTSIVIHTTGNAKATALNEATNIHNNAGINSFNAVADELGVWETVAFKDTAHHAGNKAINLSSLGFELSDNNPEKGYDNFVKYIAWVMLSLGLTPNDETVKFHSEIVPTSCGEFLKTKGKEQIIKDLDKYIEIAKGGATEKPVPTPVPAPAPKPQAPSKKTNEQLAQEVKLGLWGNDPQRSTKLKQAGYDPKTIQAIVNGNSPSLSPKPQSVSNATYINLHPKSAQYAVYRTNLPVEQMRRPNNFANVSPKNMGGLSYVAKKVANTSNVYEITTRDFGKVHIALVSGLSTITNKPMYKVF